VHLPWRPEHLLAARYELARGALAGSSPTGFGFRLTIEGAGGSEQRRAAERLRLAVGATFIAIPAFLTLLHVALFWSYPKARENFYYAAAGASFVGIVVCDLQLSPVSSEAWRELAPRASTPFILAAIFFVLLTYLAVRVGRLPRTWIGFAVTGAGLAMWSWSEPSLLARLWGWYAYYVAMVVEIVRVEAGASKLPRKGISVLLGGLAIQAVIVHLQILINLGAVAPIAGVSGVYVFGQLALAIAMSLFLAGTFARTSAHLERGLVEVAALSQQVLTQERAAHEQELRRRLLEAEDARKTSEIAAARHLQLSMLPGSLPEVEGLETAAVMTTATEVGGDYYDFKTGGDGSLIVALGDATGHGLAAGTMVTAVKAIFSVLGLEASLPEMLAECDRALRGMNVRPLHMCLTLARIAPAGVTVCSAAMPPVLLYRAGTGDVEELGAGGLPLGAGLPARWQERRTSLAAGDTLLLATDGLVELLAPDGEALGFEGAAGAFRDAAGAPAGEVLQRLMERVTTWRGEREPTDDLTLVAVRALAV
jgi:serine phosphatase RsbU (regulator of sigma subunit)